MNMKTLKTAIALFVFGAGMAQAVELPSGVTQDDVDSFIQAMLDNSCLVATDADGDTIETATGFDEEKLEIIVGYLIEQGQVTGIEAGEGIRLVNEACE
ncbi:hypothetical protein [Aliiroseovarius sp.]|uniref:hypothetical protein n=1 Tax=Aliiroseovarius sp. TaxID=1872442 RepID=UPI002608B5D8|nr:hypothetical protein [Aliiroseovarius sp.]